MIRTSSAAMLLLVAPLALGACKKQQATPAPAPAPAAPAAPVQRGPDADSMARAEAERARLAVEAARGALLATIYYEFDSDELRPDARATLDAKLRVLNANPQVRVRIDGHCDERGTDQYNLALGRRRADQAKRYLMDRGIDPTRIETMSYGRERPAMQGSPVKRSARPAIRRMRRSFRSQRSAGAT
jgi:peptidoglycan-associated lipoprotein